MVNGQVSEIVPAASHVAFDVIFSLRHLTRLLLRE